MKIADKLIELFDVKTIVTFAIVAVFVILALRETVIPESIMNIVVMVVSFYFGTQHEKKRPIAKEAETQE